MNLRKKTFLLRKALSKGQNKLIADLLVKLSFYQRCKLNDYYEMTFNRTLQDDFCNQLAGLFEYACINLVKSYHQLNADIIEQAFMSEKFSLLPIIDVFFTNHPEDINRIKFKFVQKYDEQMEEYCWGIKNQQLADITHRIVTAERDQSTNVDLLLALEDAQQFYQAGTGLAYVKQSELLDFLCTKNWSQLDATFKFYHKISGNHLEVGLRRYFDGDLQEIFTSLVYCARNSVDYLAERLHEAIKTGNSDHSLINILVSRVDKDLDDIKKRYKSMFIKNLDDQLNASLESDLKYLLVSLVQK